MTTPRKIGLMGGTFDPIHQGHLLIANEAAWRLKLDQVLFIPTGDPPHKRDHIITPAAVRLEMVQRAIAGNPLFEVSTIEVDRQGLSYTVDTLEALHKLYQAPAESPLTPVEFYFIIGADAAADLLSWYQPKRVLEMAHLVVADRPGYVLPLEKLQAGLPDFDLTNRLLALDVPMVEIASHELRARVARNIPIKYLVPDEVADYIQQAQLYRS